MTVAESPTIVHGVEMLHFCDFRSGRFAIERPYVKNKILCATDARILLAFPSDESDSDLNGKRAPDPLSVIDQVINVRAEAVWPVSFPSCRKCGSVKNDFPLLRAECRECEGNGSSVCDMGHEHDCDRCDGYGFIGGGKSCGVDPNCRVGLGGKTFDRKYISLINALPRPLKYAVTKDLLVVRGPNEMIVVLCAFKGEEE